MKKKKEIPRYPYDKRLDRVCELFKGKPVVFDLTSDETLSSIEIEDLYTPEGGYKKLGTEGQVLFQIEYEVR